MEDWSGDQNWVLQGCEVWERSPHRLEFTKETQQCRVGSQARETPPGCTPQGWAFQTPPAINRRALWCLRGRKNVVRRPQVAVTVPPQSQRGPRLCSAECFPWQLFYQGRGHAAAEMLTSLPDHTPTKSPWILGWVREKNNWALTDLAVQRKWGTCALSTEEDGCAQLCDLCKKIIFSLRYNWLTTLHTFKVYDLMIWSMYILENDHHSKFTKQPLPHIVTILFLRTFKIYCLRSFQRYNAVMLTIVTMLWIISPENTLY